MDEAGYYLAPYAALPGIYYDGNSDSEPDLLTYQKMECRQVDTVTKIGKLSNGTYVHFETDLCEAN